MFSLLRDWAPLGKVQADPIRCRKLTDLKYCRFDSLKVLAGQTFCGFHDKKDVKCEMFVYIEIKEIMHYTKSCTKGDSLSFSGGSGNCTHDPSSSRR